MKIRGLLPVSLIDYPERISAVLFTQGCNLKCPYCHNPELIPLNDPESIQEKDIFAFLNKRVGKLDAVCITGGEPLIHQDIISFIKKIKELGFLVKVDTNGSNPEMLKKIINEKAVDFIALDIKTSKEKYPDAVGNVPFNLENLDKCIEIVRQFGNFEFRTTVVPGIVNRENIVAIADWLQPNDKVVLQQFKKNKNLFKDFWIVEPYPKSTLEEYKSILESKIKKVKIRGI